MRHLARILCAIDLEKASEAAFDRALRLAVIGDAKLFLLHATPANVRFSSRARERLEYLTHLRKRAEAAGVKVRGGGGSERDRFPSAFCVVPRGRFSSFLGMLRLGSWRRNMPGPPRRNPADEQPGHQRNDA